MLATGRGRAIAGGGVVLVILGALLYYFLTRGAAAPTAPAHLQIYVGNVQTAPSGGNFSAAANGSTLNEGDTIKTLTRSKAAVNYADGSLTRMDSDTKIQLKVIDHPGVSYNTEMVQSSGKTWNRVKSLVGGSTFKTQGPNSSTAEARGTDYLFWILPDGTIKVDDFGGSVDFTFAGKTVHLAAGQFSQSGPGGPTAPGPIPAADLADPFVLFSQAANANPGEDQTGIGPDNFLSTGQSSATQDSYTADGNSDLAFTLNWPGSTFGVILIGPDGTEYPEQASSTPPYTVLANHAAAGEWTYRVHDQISADKEPWEMVIGHITPSVGTPQVFFGKAATVCDQKVTAGQTDSFKFSAFSYSGPVSFSTPDSLPDYATFKDDKKGTATVTFAPPTTLAESKDVSFKVDAKVGGQVSTQTCTEHVSALKNSSQGGTVVSGGSGVAGVTVTLVLPDATTQSVVTDGSGGFDFTGLGPGTYTVAVTVPNGYFSDSTSATVTLDGIAAGSPLTFRLAQFSIVTGSGPNGALPNGSVGDPYCSILSLLNAVDPVTWSISSGAMPTGTGIDSVGHCHGTPTAAGTFNFSLTATDALGRAAGNSYSVQIFPAPAINAPVPLSFAPVDNLKPWDVGFTESQTLSSTGGIAPYTYSVSSGSLPSGLALDPSSGVISGAPSVEAATYAAGIKVTDSVGAQAYRDVFFTVILPPRFNSSLQDFALRGASYSRYLYFNEGLDPYTVTASGLPPGVSASVAIVPGEGGPQPALVLSGTPTVAGNYKPSLTVHDSIGGSATLKGSLTVYFPALSISTPTVPPAVVGKPFSLQATAAGGFGQRTFGANLPPGLTIDPATGLISGIPTQAGCFSYTQAYVTDSTGFASVSLLDQVLPAASGIVFCTQGLPPGDISVGYSQQIVAIGGAAALQYSLSGTYPASLTISATTGLLSSPAFTSQEGPNTYNFSITATDGGNSPATLSVTLSVYRPPTLSPTTLPSGTVDSLYQAYFPVSTSAYPPITPVLVSGNLPNGLYLYDCNGNGQPCIYGYPTSAGGPFTFTLEAIDGFGASPANQVSYTIPSIATIPLTFNNPGPNLRPSEVGGSYSDYVSISGGSQPYNWSVTGVLPPGLTAEANGGYVHITGTPTTAGSFTSTYQVTDSLDAQASISYTIVVDPTLKITTQALPGGDVTESYSQPIAITGGSGSGNNFFLTCSRDVVAYCQLPGGIAIDANTGVITTSPTPLVQVTTYHFGVEVQDGDGNLAWAAYSLYFADVPAVQTTSLPNAGVGSSYCQSLVAGVGTGPFTWSLTGGSLPSGVALDQYGHLTGTPAAAGAYSFTVTATDAAGLTATHAYTVVVT